MKDKLNAVKLGIAAGIVTGICVILSVLSGVFGIFEGYSLLIVQWLDAIYGFIGFSNSYLGAILGGLYSAIDTFIFVFLIAWIYNRL